ncbi:(2Fe-2S)-binding protein [Chloroflexota bacterium]
MRTVSKLAVVDTQKCTACSICVRLCPVQAIKIEKNHEKRLAVITEQKCLDCGLCFTRCPEYAVTMVERDTPIKVGIDMTSVSEKAVGRVCKAAHMYPDQVICYCHRVRAKEIAAAIVQGAKTPEDISRATGARTGCGTLCITGIIRLLRAAGVILTKAPGYQWYGLNVSIWEMSPEIRRKYSQYYLAEDLRDVNKVFPGEGKSL